MKERVYDYDVVIVGGGPGGYVAAIKAAQAGLKTAIVEKDNFGGTCLNRGCIPTKTFVKSVGVYQTIKSAADFAVEIEGAEAVKVSMEKLQARKQAVVSQLVGGIGMLLQGYGVEVIKGEGAFADDHTIQVKDCKVTANQIIIATGSEPVMPKFIEYEGDTRVITSSEALDLNYIPESINIIGGGVIGIEFAYIFSHLGAKVTVFELMDQILPMVDKEISTKAQRLLKKAGVTFYTGTKVKKIQDFSVIYEKNSTEGKVDAQLTLMSVGRVPNVGGLAIENAGIEMQGRSIAVDEYLRTNVEHIYAIGDVNGKSMLAHTASHEGMIAVENILGKNRVMDYDAIPSCIYIEPEIASIGLTEVQAKEKYGSVKVGKFPMMANGKSLIEGEMNGMIKVVLSEDNQILGVHIFAVHATDMISQISIAMSSGLKANDVMHAVFPHPTISEAVGEAFMSACGSPIHSM